MEDLLIWLKVAIIWSDTQQEKIQTEEKWPKMKVKKEGVNEEI